MTELGPGILYVKNNDDWSPLCEVEEATVEYADEKPSSVYPFINITEALGELCGTIKITTDQLRNFLGVTNSYILNICPNRKVAHLAKHAKKRRVRKKNIHRVIKILEKEG